MLEKGDEYESRRWVSVVKQIIESQTWMDTELTSGWTYQRWLGNKKLEPRAVRRSFARKGVVLEEFELWDSSLNRSAGRGRAASSSGSDAGDAD